MRDFLIAQIDIYLLSKSSEWSEALAVVNLERMSQIRDEAHAMVDVAFDYKLDELQDG